MDGYTIERNEQSMSRSRMWYETNSKLFWNWQWKVVIFWEYFLFEKGWSETIHSQMGYWFVADKAIPSCV